jgi:hypothetical protein
MSKNKKPWSAANFSRNGTKAGRTLIEIPVDAAARNAVFYTPLSNEELVAIHVPLYAHDEVVRWEWATVLEEDFFRMTQEDYSPSWTKTDDGPVESHDWYEDEYVNIARYILGADENDKITYLDGDCFNLRRDSLAIVKEASLLVAAYPRTIELSGVVLGERPLH